MPKEEELLEVEEIEETESKKEKKKVNHGMFADTIKAYLDGYSKEDTIFAERYSNPDKNIDDCCNYIINQVRASGRNGFADEEIYALARGYYTDDIEAKDLQPTKATVVVNHQIELSEEEKTKAKEKAIAEYEAQVKKQLEDKARKEQLKKIEAEEKAAKKEAERKEKEQQAEKERAAVQTDLFEFLEG